jgi:hypothetical protein
VSFPWEPAIPQAMQQHGGRNRLVANSSAALAAVPEPAAYPLVLEGPERAPAADALPPDGPNRGC